MCTPAQFVGVLRTTAQILWEGEEQKGEEKGKKIHFQSSNRPAKDSRTHHRAAHNKEVVTTVYWPCGRDLLPSFPRLLEWRRPSGGAALVAVFI